MEILTCVLTGALEHKDSMGNGSVIRPGDWQYMSAGTGVIHSEFNPSRAEPVHLLQIWIVPDAKGHQPRYDQKRFDPSFGAWTTVATYDGRDGSLKIRQDATVSTAHLRPGNGVTYDFAAGRGGWLQVATGRVTVNGQDLKEGDGLAIEGEKTIEVRGVETGQVILFDLK
jgi:redox-sensitive bicupin YhaK (pirin superfamily)